MEKNSKIFVAGHKGMVGSAVVRQLEKQGYHNIITVPKRTVDLTKQEDVENWFKFNVPEYVFLCAAKVGGIVANKTQPASFIQENLDIQNNVIKHSHLYGVKKLLFLGSSCIYPKMAKQPITEDQLLTGLLEPTNEAYAIAKIAGLKMCQFYNQQYGTQFMSCMPTNLYGVNDNFHPENSHVIPGLIHKFIQAKKFNLKTVECWGTGSPKREFLYVDDMASACIHIMNNYKDYNSTINVGVGEDISIYDLANMIASYVGWQGEIKWDTTKPDGTPRKILDVSKLKALGWEPKTSLKEGLLTTITWYLSHKV